MELWGAALYGDPCRECGYEWQLAAAEAVRMVGDMPGRFADALVGCSGQELHPDLAWTVSGYVCHVADNLRIWAERLAGARLSGDRRVLGYDQDLLAQARQYNEVNLQGALWGLDWAARCWVVSMQAALSSDVVLEHGERGEQRADDVARNNSHDAYHHLWDVERIVGHCQEDSSCSP